MVQADKDGHQSLYRDRDWQKIKRRKQEDNKKDNWLAKVGYDTVIMVPSTPGGKLAEMYKQVVQANPGPVHIKIQEAGGLSVKSVVQKINPTKTSGCDSSDCMACKNEKGRGGECRRNNVGYELICDICGAEVSYIGETGRNVYTRGLEHSKDYRGMKSDSSLWKHAQLAHGGQLDVSYSMKSVKSLQDPLSRQVNEGVQIYGSPATTKLNSKCEWFGPATVRLVAEGGGWG